MKSLLTAILIVSVSTLAHARAAAPADLSLYALDKQAHAQSPTAKRIGELVQGTAERTDWMVSLTAGTCYVIAARGDENVRHVSLFLWAPDGKRVAAEKPHGLSTTMRYCSSWNGTFHVQAKTEGHGAYVVGTYTMSPNTTKIASAPPLVGAPAPPPVLPAPAPEPIYVPVVQPVYVQPTYVQPAYVAPATTTRTVIVVPGGGAACSSSIDCGSGEFCKEDSTGYKVCMGHGGRGSACSSSIDCGGGRFCKEDSDGYKMCM